MSASSCVNTVGWPAARSARARNSVSASQASGRILIATLRASVHPERGTRCPQYPVRSECVPAVSLTHVPTDYSQMIVPEDPDSSGDLQGSPCQEAYLSVGTADRNSRRAADRERYLTHSYMGI